AGDVAAAACDAFVLIDHRLGHAVQVEETPVGHTGQRPAAQLRHAREPLGVEIAAETAHHVLDDLEAEDHRRGAHLHRPCAEGDELERIAPTAYAADAGD